MDVNSKVVVVTGGADGIGAALCRRFAREGAKAVVVVDRNGDGAAAVAREIGGEAVTLDVSDGEAMAAMVADVEARHGGVDLFCSNAGIGDGDPDKENAASSPDAVWERAWKVNVMAHVHAARAAIPGMRATRRTASSMTSSPALSHRTTSSGLVTSGPEYSGCAWST